MEWVGENLTHHRLMSAQVTWQNFDIISGLDRKEAKLWIVRG